MSKDQLFNKEESSRDFVYFSNAVISDGFDISIREVPKDNQAGDHAKVEVIFYQRKGDNKVEVVSAVRLQLYELEQFARLAQRRIEDFRKAD